VPQAEHALLSYDWPGNVRELSNVIERALFRSEDGTIHLHDLPIYITHDRKTAAKSTTMSLKNVHSTVEEDTLRYALESVNHNKVKAARLLGIHRSNLYKKIKKYGIYASS
jgi:transcriptional regulator of acetoin/glycerol metabolism